MWGGGGGGGGQGGEGGAANMKMAAPERVCVQSLYQVTTINYPAMSMLICLIQMLCLT